MRDPACQAGRAWGRPASPWTPETPPVREWACATGERRGPAGDAARSQGRGWDQAVTTTSTPTRRPDRRTAVAADRTPIISNGLPTQLPDIDAEETQEWLDSLDAVVDQRGRNRARYLMLA